MSKIIKDNINKYSIIYFGSTWCSYCPPVKKIFKELSAKYKKVISFQSVDIDKNSNITKSYEIQSIPTIVVLKYNQEVKRFIGHTTKKEIDNFLKNLIKK